MKKPQIGVCAYCGEEKQVEKEHVVPRNIFDKAGIRDRARFIQVPACRECNGDPSADEESFRNSLILIGSWQEASSGVFYNEMLKSLKQGGHGPRKLNGLLKRIKEFIVDGQTVYRMDLNERDYRVFRKIVRGLTYHHFLEPCLEARVMVVKNPVKLPQELMDSVPWRDVHPDVFRYKLVPSTPCDGMRAYWFLEFFRTVEIVGIVKLP